MKKPRQLKKKKKQNDNELEPQDIRTIFYRKFSARTQEKAKKFTLPKKLLLQYKGKGIK